MHHTYAEATATPSFSTATKEILQSANPISYHLAKSVAMQIYSYEFHNVGSASNSFCSPWLVSQCP